MKAENKTAKESPQLNTGLNIGNTGTRDVVDGLALALDIKRGAK